MAIQYSEKKHFMVGECQNTESEGAMLATMTKQFASCACEHVLIFRCEHLQAACTLKPRESGPDEGGILHRMSETLQTQRFCKGSSSETRFSCEYSLLSRNTQSLHTMTPALALK